MATIPHHLFASDGKLVSTKSVDVPDDEVATLKKDVLELRAQLVALDVKVDAKADLITKPADPRP